nr:MAG TPA: hypothetical protein [Myoviridae sp. ctDOq19]
MAATLRCPKLPANTAKSSECLNCRLIKLKNHAFKFPYRKMDSAFTCATTRARPGIRATATNATTA